MGAVIARANQAYSAFLHSGEGAGFCGQVRGDLGKALLWAAAGAWLRGAPRSPCVEGLGAPSFLALGTGACSPQVVLLGDCVGGILGFDALCQSRAGSGGSRSSSRRGSLVSASTLPLVREGGKGGSRPWVLGCRRWLIRDRVLAASPPAEHGAHLPGVVRRQGSAGRRGGWSNRIGPGQP